MATPLQRLRHHVTGAIERGEAVAITEVPAAVTAAQLRELRAIDRTGEPSDPCNWHPAGALGFYARDKVLGALLRRGLIENNGDFRLTEAGRAVLRASEPAPVQGGLTL